MTIDEQIEAALERGDVEAAMLLAASLPRSQAYQDAMKRIGEIVDDGMASPKASPDHAT